MADFASTSPSFALSTSPIGAQVSTGTLNNGTQYSSYLSLNSPSQSIGQIVTIYLPTGQRPSNGWLHPR